MIITLESNKFKLELPKWKFLNLVLVRILMNKVLNYKFNTGGVTL